MGSSIYGLVDDVVFVGVRRDSESRPLSMALIIVRIYYKKMSLRFEVVRPSPRNGVCAAPVVHGFAYSQNQPIAMLMD